MILVLILASLVSSFALASDLDKEGHITLLAVTHDNSGNMMGATADLYLEIREGTGRIFFDTYPLTKIDTQISTRYAKDIACSYSEVDCTKYDFFYTIRSNSPIIGGPSAGAAISLLTSAMLLDLDYEKNISVTGTINSAGVIGPVGGIDEKVMAASDSGIKKVLLPLGEGVSKKNEAYLSLKKTPEIIQVSTLDDAMEEFTGRRKYYTKKEISIPEDYKKIMKNFALELCNRSTALKEGIDESKFDYIYNDQYLSLLINDSDNLSMKAEIAYSNEDYYSAASYCFGSGVYRKELELNIQNLTEEEITEKNYELLSEIREYEQNIDQKALRTITDLQTYMIVKSRIIEAKERINDSLDSENRTKVHNLAYAYERFNSAKVWSGFFDSNGVYFKIDKDVLKDSCLKKIDEARERYHYSMAYVPNNLDHIKKKIDDASADSKNGDYALCLFKASKAKAEADIILNVVTINSSRVDTLISQKLEVAEDTIGRNSEEGIFPLLGFSYYEYASNLRNDDPMSSMLYAEYSLELSDFSIYFPKEKKETANFDFDRETASIFIVGFLTGIVFMMIVLFFKPEKKAKIRSIKKSKKKKRRMNK